MSIVNGKLERAGCGHCHTCGFKLWDLRDGKEWCGLCGVFREYLSHGYNVEGASLPPCPTAEDLVNLRSSFALADGGCNEVS